jgi:hypothetical protein
MDNILGETVMFLALISQTHASKHPYKYFDNGRMFLGHLVSGLDINWPWM